MRGSLGQSSHVSVRAACLLCCLCFVSCYKSPPRVTLTWQAPQPTPGISVVGYNVYRSTISGRQFVRLASRVSGPPYEDRLVSNGRTYFDVVTSLDQEGHESMFSVETSVTIP
jgi:fibronectin type 3 domain-containing protein